MGFSASEKLIRYHPKLENQTIIEINVRVQYLRTSSFNVYSTQISGLISLSQYNISNPIIIDSQTG